MFQHTLSNPHSSANAFALIMVVLLTTVFSGALAIKAIKQTQVDRIEGLQYTHSRLAEIQRALNVFIFLHHRLPCPAGLSVNYSQDSSAPLGYESYQVDTQSCQSHSYTLTEAGDTETIYYGTVPFASLGIGRKNIIDYWQNKIVYLVSARYIQNAFISETTLLNTSSNLALYYNDRPIAKPVYLLISHGANAFGAIKFATLSKRNQHPSELNYQNRPAEIYNSMFDSSSNRPNGLGKKFILRSDNRYFDDIIFYQDIETLQQFLFREY